MNDKDRPEVVFLGITMTAAFTLFAKKVVREHRIPYWKSLCGFKQP